MTFCQFQKSERHTRVSITLNNTVLSTVLSQSVLKLLGKPKCQTQIYTLAKLIFSTHKFFRISKTLFFTSVFNSGQDARVIFFFSTPLSSVKSQVLCIQVLTQIAMSKNDQQDLLPLDTCINAAINSHYFMYTNCSQ